MGGAGRGSAHVRRQHSDMKSARGWRGDVPRECSGDGDGWGLWLEVSPFTRSCCPAANVEDVDVITVRVEV